MYPAVRPADPAARNLIPSLAGSFILRSRMAVAIGLRETNILRVRDNMLRIQMSVRKGTQNAGHLRVPGICSWRWTRTAGRSTEARCGAVLRENYGAARRLR